MRQLAAGTLALWACGGALAPSPAVPDAGSPPIGDVTGADAGVPAQIGPTLAGCRMFPADNAWNRDVSADPVDPHSADYLGYMGAGSLYVQPDFGGHYGQPYMVVPATQPRVP